MESIFRRRIDDPDRSSVQEAVACAVERDPDWFIEQYCLHPGSFGGRYIAADLFKETFSQYRESRETRNLYNTCVHNSAAVLASEQFNRILGRQNVVCPNDGKVLLLTGIPGAGKTSSILSGGKLPDDIYAIFEGQLFKPETTIPKILQVLEAGLQPVIAVVHTEPGVALRNTFQRFNEQGRGASIGIMAEIQGKLPDGLLEVYKHFGDSVQLEIIDRRGWLSVNTISGWEQLDVLKSEGNQEQIKQQLGDILENYKSNGLISEACYRQACGEAPLGRIRLGMGDAGSSEYPAHDGGRKISQGSSQESVVADDQADEHLSLIAAHALVETKWADAFVVSAYHSCEYQAARVFGLTERHAVFSLGRFAIICSQSALDRDVVEGERVSVTFVSGKGRVSPPAQVRAVER